MASAVFFLDLKGKVGNSMTGQSQNHQLTLRQTLLARNYRGDIPMSAVEKFPVLLSEAEEESSAVPPCFSDEGINVRPFPPDPYTEQAEYSSGTSLRMLTKR
jgi:AP-1 complex subunit mu